MFSFTGSLTYQQSLNVSDYSIFDEKIIIRQKINLIKIRISSN